MYPIGPGFFIFFQNDNVAPLGPAQLSPEPDKEIIELIQFIFTFLEGEPNDSSW